MTPEGALVLMAVILSPAAMFLPLLAEKWAGDAVTGRGLPDSAFRAMAYEPGDEWDLLAFMAGNGGVPYNQFYRAGGLLLISEHLATVDHKTGVASLTEEGRKVAQQRLEDAT